MKYMKRCPRCETKKEVDDFNYQARAKDGCQGYCRSCQSDWAHEYYNRKRKYKRRNSGGVAE